LRLGAMRRNAADILATARTQRWAPDELLRTLVDLETASRDQSNARNRLVAARFPVTKTLDELHSRLEKERCQRGPQKVSSATSFAS